MPECIGLRQISGVGGQVAFVRGVNMSKTIFKCEL